MKPTLPAAVRKLAESVPSEIVQFLGPPPLLRTEDAATYYALIGCFAKDIGPTDCIVWLLIKGLADISTEIARNRRFKAGVVEREQKKALRAEVERVEQKFLSLEERIERDPLRASLIAYGETSREEKLEEEARRIAKGLPPRPPKKTDETSQADAKARRDFAELKKRAPTEDDYLATIESWMPIVEQIDRQMISLERRFSTALREVEEYMGGFGRTLRANLEQLVDENVTINDEGDAPRQSQQLRSRRRALSREVDTVTLVP